MYDEKNVVKTTILCRTKNQYSFDKNIIISNIMLDKNFLKEILSR